VSHFVAHILDLVTSYDVVQVVVLAERLCNVRPKLDAHTSFGRPPARPLLGIGPQELAHKTFFGRLAVALNAPYIVQGHVVIGEEAAVHHQDLLVDAVA